jgi:hypothetical protein
MLDGLPRPRGATDSILKEVGLTFLWTNILKGARAKGAGCTLIPDTEDRDAEVERLVKLGAPPSGPVAIPGGINRTVIS